MIWLNAMVPFKWNLLRSNSTMHYNLFSTHGSNFWVSVIQTKPFQHYFHIVPCIINSSFYLVCRQPMKVCFLGPFVVLWQRSCVILVNNNRIYKVWFFIINYSPVWFLFTRNITTAPFLLKGFVYPWWRFGLF